MPNQRRHPVKATTTIAILAGGLSTRMGRDKARLRLGRRTLLGHVRAAAEATGLRVRVIRKDAVPRCGPLGGIVTMLRRTQAQRVLFLSCDQPLISADLLRWVLAKANSGQSAVFCDEDGVVGFPFVLMAETLPVVEAQIGQGKYSLQMLAKVLGARRVNVPRRRLPQLLNVNTPAELERLRKGD